MYKELELIPNQSAISQPFFKTNEKYKIFRLDFYNSVKQALDRNAEARAKSELESMFRIVD